MIRKPQEKLSEKMFECAGSSFKANPPPPHEKKQKQKQKQKQKRKDQTPEGKLLYIQLTISFLIDRKCKVNFPSQRLRRHLDADYTIIMPRTLTVHGNHVIYDGSA